MSDTSELLSDTPEWADIQPLPIPDAARAAVDIQYSDDYIDTFGLLYACVEAGEKSERALKLTEKCITMSASHYTAWQFRFQCLVATNADMDEEWKICMAILHSNAKNYQLWNHRRKCALRMGAANAKREMEFAAAGLEIDAKNYHIWAHRQVLVSTFGMWKQEWKYAEKLITEDPRNNSAWNQRAWLLKKSLAARLNRNNTHQTQQENKSQSPALDDDPQDLQPRFLSGPIQEWLDREIQYTKEHVRSMPHNESAWNYLVGLRDTILDVLRLEFPPGTKFSEEQAHEMSGTLVSLSDQSFSVALDIANADPMCIPARVALFKLYLAIAAPPNASNESLVACVLAQLAGDQERQNAVAAVKAMAEPLAMMDPIHSGWYRAVASRLAKT